MKNSTEVNHNNTQYYAIGKSIKKLPKHWKTGFSEEQMKQRIDFACSDNPGCERPFNPSLCEVRHKASLLKEKKGRRLQFDPCAYCPLIINYLQNNPSKIK